MISLNQSDFPEHTEIELNTWQIWNYIQGKKWVSGNEQLSTMNATFFLKSWSLHTLFPLPEMLFDSLFT